MQSEEYCTGGLDPEDIVISGVAGRFPECDNVGNWKKALTRRRTSHYFPAYDTQKARGGQPTARLKHFSSL
ncbi:hypothetical protein CEXT_56081 [Caerostris extrusa]|uniref:Beta-ketoacyl synthase N-terminal domain-containing protein n=1 Tax=Caerostris extrusa TaxID=172846 RepID=A0AAV4M5X1_CAEEX|nr:hypothetical protein CEXT_56081 [Caerostris extrusa]